MNRFLVIFWISLVLQGGHADASGSFKLIENDAGAAIYYAGNETAVETAIEMLVDDSRQVCRQPVERINSMRNNTIVIGIPDREPALNELLSRYNVQASDLKGIWEGYKLIVSEANGEKYLFVLGSDPRGAAYGVLELSRQMGVTPWVWWADVVPEKKTDVSAVADGQIYAPSVQYRGIFLNDEDWALMPWSTRTFEPTFRTGAIGPKTYSRIFELLLRLRANTIWPAMHECTVPFFSVEGNREAAEKYGIVLSTSHAEPMMRTNTGEWDNAKYGAFNFFTNKEQVLSYWEERVKQLTLSENIYTVGMRGIHDGRMQGVSSLDDETQTLFKVIDEQRNMLERHYTDKDISAIPQIFVPYKEVLTAYDNGLKLPEDVTLVWCDDNHGYIMRLSNPEEKKRSGGAGVYYHVSYWGKPHDYLWLGSTQPGLIYAEMKRAWDHGARRFWILNVGDIKPNEYLAEFFLDMAWDIDSFAGNRIDTHRKNWVNAIFNGVASDEINAILKSYYQLAARRKPEHLGWNQVEVSSARAYRGLEPVMDTEFSPFYFGDEMYSQLEAYRKIARLSEEVMENQIPVHLKPAYFQLVHYPVAAACAMNRKMLYAQKSRLYAGYGLPVAAEYARLAMDAYNEIAALDYAYNKDMLNGKWELMMDMKPRDLPVFQQPVLPVLPDNYAGNAEEPVIWIENDTVPVNGNVITLPAYSGKTGEAYFVTIQAKAKQPVHWRATNVSDGLEMRERETGLLYERQLIVKINSPDATTGSFPLFINGKEYTIIHTIEKVSMLSGHHNEYNRMIAINASDFSNSQELETIESLGSGGRTVRLPENQKMNLRSPYLEYKINTFSHGNVRIKVGVIPRHPVNGGEIRYALVIDNQKPQVVSTKTEFLTPEWAENVLRNRSVTEIDAYLEKPGPHTIRIFALDEPLLVDQIMLDFYPNRKHYLIPCSP